MIVTVRGPGDSQISVHVPRPFARIGSDRFAEVCLPQGDLLPCNLYLHATDTGIYCLGLSQSAPNGWLTPHTRAEIGPYRIKAVFDDEGPPPLVGESEPRKKSAAAVPAPLLRIRERNSNRKPVELSVDRPLTVIGRRSPSVFRMTHRTVSRVHCVLYWNGESLWAIDLLSANRTLLEQAPIEAALWNPGQNLALGDFRIGNLGLNEQASQPPPAASVPPQNEARSAPSKRRRARRRLPKRRQRASDSLGRKAAIPKQLAEQQTSAQDLSQPRGNGQSAEVETEVPTCFPLSVAFPPRSAPTLSREVKAPLAVARGEGDLTSCEPGSLAAKGSPPMKDVRSDRETSESERQLLHALRALAAAAGADSRGGELPPDLIQALLAMVQQALSQTNHAEQIQAEESPVAGLQGLAQRLALEADGSVAPARLLEQELSLVSLTLVKARQIAETSRVPAQADVDRLIDAMGGLEARLAELVETSRDRRIATLENREPLAPTGPAAALVERRPLESGELAARAPALEPPQPRQALTRVPPPDGEQAASEFQPEAPGKEVETASRTPARIAGPQPTAPTEPLMDDEMLSRLVDFKAKQDHVDHRRKVVWTATAAVALILIVVATGAAKFLLSGPKPDGASEFLRQDYAKVAK